MRSYSLCALLSPALKTKFFHLLLFGFLFISSLTGQRTLFNIPVEEANFTSEQEQLLNTFEIVDIRLVEFSGVSNESQLQLQLFDNTSYMVDYLYTDTFSIGSKAWVGKIANQPFSSVILAEAEGTWFGKIEDDNGKRYLLVATNQEEIYNLVELGEHTFNEGPHEMENNLRETISHSRSAAGVCDVSSTCSKQTVDLLLLYTDDVRINQGGEASVRAYIAMTVADMNMINVNSCIDDALCFNLRACEEYVYNETDDDGMDLSALSMDANILALRNAHGADLVALITDASYCGRGYIQSSPTFSPNAAFSVSSYACAGPNRTLAHEIGHNMGLRHDRYSNTTAAGVPCAQSHGFASPTAGMRTIMAYNTACTDAGTSCMRVPFWSDPNKNFPGTTIPMGSTVAGQEANNAYVLERAACQVAEFRQHPISNISSGVVTCSGDDATFKVTFTTTNGTGTGYNIYNSTTVFDATTLVGTATGPADGMNMGMVTIPGPTTAMTITLTIRDANHPGCDEEITVAIPKCASCPTFTIPTALSITSQSTCGTGCAPAGGAWALASNPCPTGSSLQSFASSTITTGGIGMTAAPAYNQTTAETYYVRCVCDTDATAVSTVQTISSTPVACTLPASPSLTIANNVCPSTTGMISASGSGGALAYFTGADAATAMINATVDLGGSTTAPTYAAYPTVVYVCVVETDGNGCRSTPRCSQTSPNNCIITPSFALDFGDPCSCTDPLNCTTPTGALLFHDLLTVNTNPLTTGLDIRVATSSDFFIDVPCNGGVLTAPTSGLTQISPKPGSPGVYELTFWRPEGILPTLTVTNNGGAAITVPSPTFQPLCSCEETSIPEEANIPTMSQWGLVIYGLLILNIGLILLYRREAFEISERI